MTEPDGPDPDEPEPTAHELGQAIEAQNEALLSLRQEVDALRQLTAAGPGVGAAKTGPAPRWFDLRGPDPVTADAAHDQFDQLTTWVRWLVVAYPPVSKELPACWPLHSELVEELTALWAAHSHAYRPGGPWDDPLRWHEWLHGARTRWAQWNTRGCAAAHKGPVAAKDLPTPSGPALVVRPPAFTAIGFDHATDLTWAPGTPRPHAPAVRPGADTGAETEAVTSAP